MDEQLDIVDDKNQVINQTSKSEVYERKLNHRIVHVFLIHPETGQIYLQKRSEAKSFLPGYYCTSAGGHVRAGESYEDAAKRELHEELGLDVPVHGVHTFLFESDGHKRFIELFVAYARDGFQFAREEVAGGAFSTLEEVRRIIEGGEKIHPQLDVCFRWFYQTARDLSMKNRNPKLAS